MGAGQRGELTGERRLPSFVYAHPRQPAPHPAAGSRAPARRSSTSSSRPARVFSAAAISGRLLSA